MFPSLFPDGGIQQGSTRYQSAHFTLILPNGVDPGTLLDALENAYRDVRGVGLKLPSMILVRSYSSTDEFVRSAGGDRSDLAVAQDERIHLQPLPLLLRRQDAPFAYRHELTHVGLAKAARHGLPRWVNEGVAMVVAGERQPEQFRFGRVDQLEDSLGRSRSYLIRRSAYGAAGRLVSDLMTRYGRSRVIALLRSVAAGGGFERRFRVLTGTSSTEWGNQELRQ